MLMLFPGFRIRPCFYAALFGTLFIASGLRTFGQGTNERLPATEKLANLAPEHQPQFPGGAVGMQAYMRQALHPPAEVKAGTLQGEVVVRCVIRADGRPDSVTVIRSLSAAADQEALRVVRAMPTWQAGSVGNPPRPVAVDYVLHLPFPLPGRDAPWPRQGRDELFSWIHEPAYFPGGAPAFAAALAQHLPALPTRAPGQVYVAFVVDPVGRVRDARIEKGLGSPYDEAILTALRRLPSFVPGVMEGETVAVTGTAVIPFGSSDGGAKPRLSAGGNQRSYAVYEGSLAAQERAISARLRYPTSALRREVEGTVVVGMLVSAAGVPDPATARVLKGLGDGCDEEALRVIRSLSAFRPALLNGEPVAEQGTFSVKFDLPAIGALPSPVIPTRPTTPPRPKAHSGR